MLIFALIGVHKKTPAGAGVLGTVRVFVYVGEKFIEEKLFCRFGGIFGWHHVSSIF